MKHKLIIAIMSITAAIALTGAQFVISANTSSKILWQIDVPFKLFKPTFVGAEDGGIIMKWNPEAQLAAVCAGLIFGLSLYSCLIYMIIKKVWPPSAK